MRVIHLNNIKNSKKFDIYLFIIFTFNIVILNISLDLPNFYQKYGMRVIHSNNLENSKKLKYIKLLHSKMILFTYFIRFAKFVQNRMLEKIFTTGRYPACIFKSKACFFLFFDFLLSLWLVFCCKIPICDDKGQPHSFALNNLALMRLIMFSLAITLCFLYIARDFIKCSLC